MFQTDRAYRLSPPSFVASVLLHGAGVLLLGLVTFHSSPIRTVTLRSILIAPPPREVITHAVAHRIVPPARRFVAPPIPHREATPRLVAPVETPVIIHAAAEPVAIPVNPAPPLLPPIKLGGFENAKPADAPAMRPASKPSGFELGDVVPSSVPPPIELRTGAFGAAEAGERARSRATIAATAGFGDARSISAAAARTQAIAKAGFGDAAATVPIHQPPATEAASAVAAAEIIDKPRPAYTDEARRLNIEGEVLIEAVLEASGSIQVLRVLRGLGHGLDETAITAARQIRFRPALRDGVPVDFPAVVRISFQLAY